MGVPSSGARSLQLTGCMGTVNPRIKPQITGGNWFYPLLNLLSKGSGRSRNTAFITRPRAPVRGVPGWAERWGRGSTYGPASTAQASAGPTLEFSTTPLLYHLGVPVWHLPQTPSRYLYRSCAPIHTASHHRLYSAGHRRGLYSSSELGPQSTWKLVSFQL
jgi:hypothetical protein